jgi:hypothetical protein
MIMSRWIISMVVCVVVLMGAVDMAQANPVSKETATQLAQGWINSSSKPLGNEIDRVETVSSSEGQTLYYVVYLKPHGFVVVSANDSIEPIICFSAGSQFDATGPLGVMLGKDLRTRQDVVDSITSLLAQQASGSTATRTSPTTLANLQALLTDSQSKWSDLLAKAKGPATLQVPGKLQSSTTERRKAVLNQEPVSTPVADSSTGYAPGGFDVWIDPLVRSAWNQTKILNFSWAANLYNISTPSNRPAGCIAVAMAQLMRYHTYPAGVALNGTNNYYELNNAGDLSDTNVTWINYISSYTNLNSGLAITNLPLDPANSFTNPTGPASLQWSNIAALVFDAGLSVNTAYGTNQSAATFSKVVPALTNTFRYLNAIYAPVSNNYANIINRNLMGSKPVLMSISSSGVTNSGHVVIADGFAYSAQGTLFHHINLGWGEIGDNTAWYNLPSIIAYNTIDAFAYNIFPTNSGEMIVGRVTNSVGGGVAGVTVSAGGVTNTTDSRGFFGLIVTKNTTNTLTAVKQGYATTVMSNLAVGASSANTQGNIATFVNISQGPAFTLTAGTYSTNVLLEWTNPTNANYTGLAHILWTTNNPQDWASWSAPTGSILDGVAGAANTVTNEYPTNHVISGGSLGGAASTLSIVHSNLVLGATYYYKVWLTNSSGWVTPSTPGSTLTAQATPDTGNLTMYFQYFSSTSPTVVRLVKCLKFTPTNTVKLDTTVAITNMYAYNIASVGDFDSDNVDDILFQRNMSTGMAPNVSSASNSWYVWFMDSSGKLKSQKAVNTNDLTLGGYYTVRGISTKGTKEAMILTRSAAGDIVSFSATNGVIDPAITNWNSTGSIIVTNAVGWQSPIGVTSH